MGIFGPPNIEKLKARKDIEGLIKALSYKKDDTIRHAAAEALVRIGAPAVKPLKEALGDSDKDVRYAAVQALGRIGGQGAGWGLVSALGDSDKDVRQAAIDSLVQIGPPAVEPLINTLHYRLYRPEAAEALARIGTPAVEPLIGKLRDRDEGVRAVAVQVLSQIGDARAVSPLIALFKDGYSDVRQAAIDSLVQIGAPAVSPLIGALKVIIEGVRPAAQALVRIGAPAIKPLIGALEDPDKYVRATAADVLGDIGDRHAVEPLVLILRDENERHVRRAAAFALDQLGWKPDQDATGAIYWIARNQCEKCVQIGEPAVMPLIVALSDHNLEPMESKPTARVHAAEALGKIGDARAVEPLIAALKWGQPVQQAAADALVQIGTPAVDLLIAALKDESWGVRDTAAEALGKIADPRAVEPLIALRKDENKFVRNTAAQALVQLGDPRPIERLMAVLPDASAISDLIEIGAPAVEPLISVLKDATGTYDRDQRYRAAEALVGIYQ